MTDFYILGVKVSQGDTLPKVTPGEGLHPAQIPAQIVSTNVEAILLAQKDEAFRSVVNNSAISFVDSFGVLFAIKYLSEVKKYDLPLIARVFVNFFVGLKVGLLGFLNRKYLEDVVQLKAGSDLLFDIPKTFGSKCSVYLIGTKYENGIESAKEAQKILKERFPHITFVGNVSLREENGGKFTFISEDQVKNTIFNDVNISGLEKIDVCFVGIRQGISEKWIHENLENLPFKVMIGVGAGLDFVFSKKHRAPEFIRNLKLEWFFRLFSEISCERVKRVFIAFPYFPFLIYISSIRGVSSHQETP